MAERYAVATGNWSAVGTWDGGTTLPTTGDDVHGNGYDVTIDQNVTVGSLRTLAGSVAVAGGSFTVSGAYTVNADSHAGSTTCLTLNHASAVQNGNGYGSTTTSNRYGTLVTLGSRVGDSNGGTQTSSIGSYFTSGSHVGNCYGGSGVGAYGIYMPDGSCVLTGDSFGGSGSNALGAMLQNQAVQNGDSTAGTSSASSASGSSIFNGAIQNGDSYGSSISGTSIGTTNMLGVHNGDSYGRSVAGSHGSVVNGFAVQYGNCSGGSISGSHGTRITNNGAKVKCTLATGNTSGAFGVFADSAKYGIVVIDTESGSYAKSLDSFIDTTTTNMPLFANAEIIGILPQTIHSIESGISA